MQLFEYTEVLRQSIENRAVIRCRTCEKDMWGSAVMDLQNMESTQDDLMVFMGPCHRGINEKAIREALFSNAGLDILLRRWLVCVEYGAPWDHHNFFSK